MFVRESVRVRVRVRVRVCVCVCVCVTVGRALEAPRSAYAYTHTHTHTHTHTRHLVLHTALDEKAEGRHGSDAVDATGLRVFGDVDVDKSGSSGARLCCRLQNVQGRSAGGCVRAWFRNRCSAQRSKRARSQSAPTARKNRSLCCLPGTIQGPIVGICHRRRCKSSPSPPAPSHAASTYPYAR